MLAEARAFPAGTLDLLGGASQAVEQKGIKELARNLQKVMLVAKAAVNEIILACTGARRELPAGMTLAFTDVALAGHAGGRTMSFTHRTYLIAEGDRIYRLASAKLDRMFRDPAAHRLPSFAGQHVRMATVVIEFSERKPVCVVWTTFAILTFDGEGRLDVKRFGQQQFALAESALAPALAGGSDSNATVADAASRFVAQGGIRTPSGHLARDLDDVATGRRPCEHL